MLRKLVALAMIAAGVAAFLLRLDPENTANRDFIEYWAAGKQLVHGANPYDAGAVFALEKSVGCRCSVPQVMWNPPYALPLTAPLGLLSARVAVVLWLLLLVGCVVLSIRMIRDLCDRGGQCPNRLHLMGYCFAPVIEALFAGQTSIFALLGLTLFLRFHRTKPFIAGMALFLCGLKPHLFLPLGAALLLWILSRKSYRILWGAAFALGLNLVMAFALDPYAWSQYAHVAQTAPLEEAAIPAIAVWLRLAIAPKAVWLQFAPAATACLWAIWYYWRNPAWNWTTHGSLVMLVSVWTAPYSWFYDEAVLLPAVLCGLYCAAEMKRSLVPFLGIASVALLEVFCRVPMARGYLWTTSAWLAWYLSSVRANPSKGIGTAARPDAHPGIRDAAPVETA